MGVFHPENEDYRWININATPQFRNLEKTSFQVYATFEDITDRKIAENMLKTALKEKEVLLSEVLHRVKNNLQVISSLLTFQSDFVEDEGQKSMFVESIKRVESMAHIHEMLYQSEDFSQINFSEYTLKLCNNLFAAYVASTSKILIDVDVQEIFLDMKTAIPCGLLLNELVSNSLKHAFPKNKSGLIKVEMKTYKNGKLKLTVKDNGVGIPENLDWRNAESLGLELISLISEDQLYGEIDLSRKNGTKFTITFERQ
jgi:two-component sensor histidine kinase